MPYDHHHILLLPLLLSAVLAAADDSAAMLKLASSFTPPPSGWSSMSSDDYCTWPGVACDISLRVTSINLSSKSLSGTIAPEISSLSELRSVSLQRNLLSGTVPSFANLSNLQSVYLFANAFTSVAPGAFSGLNSLQSLSMSDNEKLTPWTFPDLSQSTDLSELQLDNTNLYGTLPDVIGPPTSLASLKLSYNNLSGTLPASLGGSMIQNLWLNYQDAGFTGTLDVLSNMTHLSQVWLHKNSFTGPIPDLSKCKSLFDLQLRDNHLTGPVPESLINLPNLKNVSLSNNKLQGPVPKFPSTDENVVVNGANNFCTDNGDPCDPQVTTMLEIAGGFGYPVFLSDDWSGNDACNWSFVTCSQGSVITVNLAKKSLTGTISPAFGNLTALKNLNLNDNQLTGSIPDSLTKLSNLQLLDVSNNNLSGDIPKFRNSVGFSYSGNSLLGVQSRGSGRATSDPGASAGGSPFKISMKWKVTIGIAAAIPIFVVLSYVIFRIWKEKQRIDKKVSAFIEKYGSHAPKKYSYSDVKKMTRNFKDKLGQGGFGCVYKGKLPDGKLIAVKVLSELKGNGEDFINEVDSISRTSHVNIVKLVGFCYENSKRALMYDFMPNGSLDRFIYADKKHPHTNINLEWRKLYQITLGIARGLEYLHQGCNTRILHFDIKPHNILLDEEFRPRISDFGLAKLCQREESIVSMLQARGTAGYMAPEVYNRSFGGVSYKSDVYSFGMMVLEMAGGRRNIDVDISHTGEIYFPHWIYNQLESGQDLKLRGIVTEDDERTARKMILVGLWCIQINPSDRPSMTKVVEMLEGSLESLQTPPQPYLSSPAREQQISSPSSITSLSHNNQNSRIQIRISLPSSN